MTIDSSPEAAGAAVRHAAYEAALAAVPGAFAVCRMEYGTPVTEYANTAFCELTGFGKEEILSTTPDQWLYTDDAALFRSKFRRAVANEESFSSLCRTRRRADGSMLRIHAAYTARPGENDTLRYFITYTDINERRLQELDEDHRFNDIMQTVATGFAILSLEPNGRCPVLYINPAMCSLLNGTQEEIFAIYKQDVLLGAHPEDLPHLMAQLQEDIRVDNDSSSVCRIKNCQGKYVWVQITSRCVRSGGHASLYCSFSDITEFLEKEALRRDKEDLEDHLAGAAQFLNCAMWAYDIETQVIHQFKKMPAFPDQPIIIEGGCEALLTSNVVHPDDVEGYRDVFRRIHYGEDTIITEYRITKDYGRLRTGWVRQIYTVKKDATGEPVEAWGIAVDINEEKRAKEKYEMQLFRRTTTDASSLGYTCWNLTKDTVLLLDFKEMPPKLANACVGGSLDKLMLLARERLTLAITDIDRIFSLVKRQSLLDAFHSERPVNLECQYISANGDLCWAQLDVSFLVEPASKDVLAFLHIYDVTDKKVAQDLIESTVRYDYEVVGRLDVLRDAVIHLTSSDARTDSGNGKAKISDLAQSFLPYIRKGDRAKFLRAFDARNILKALADKDTFEFTIHTDEPDGSTCVKRIRFADYDKTRGLLLYTRSDITETIAQQKQQQEALAAALKAAEDANSAKTTFFSRMSHDIRTPMNAIIGMASLAAQSLGDNEAVGEYISQIDTASHFLLSLINDILDISRIESGKMQLCKQEFDMESLLSAINGIIFVQAAEKGVEYKSVLHPSLASTYIGDRMKLEQVLLNVLGNAVKFTQSGGQVSLRVRETGREKDTASLRFIVSDTGVGMSDAFQRKLFEPFEQENAQGSANYGGTGLGMSITKSIVQMMNGEISVSSVKGEGSTFTIDVSLGISEQSVPISGDAACRAAEPRALGNAADAAAPAIDFTGKRALLAEDHILNVKVAQKLLEKKGFTVDVAENGQLALDAFTASDEGGYDVILMDIRMPVMDGLTASKAIRTLPRKDAASVPILAMTANAFDEDVQKSMDAGVSAHLSKPIEPDMLYQTLIQFVNRDIEKE